MSSFRKALLSWPSDASLTQSLVQKAVNSLALQYDLINSPPNKLADEKLLQWSTYDAINHELTYSYPSQVLSCSYVIRKALIRKHFMARAIHSYTTKNTQSILTSAAPKTWDFEIRFADELDELWGDELWDLGTELEKQSPHRWFILKPGMTERGMGIRLFHTKDDLVRIFEEFEEDSDEEKDEKSSEQETQNDTSVVTSHVRHFVIQEYLTNPLLFDPNEAPIDGKSERPLYNDLQGHKFHLRAYCVASGALSIYLYTRILALFSSLPFSAPSEETIETDLSRHLTNTALQLDRGEAGVRLLEELIGCHPLGSSHKRAKARVPIRGRTIGQAIDVEQVRSQMEESLSLGDGPGHVFLKEDIQDIQDQMVEILSEIFKAALDMSVHFQPLPNAFELYGIDFLVTHSLNPTPSRKYQVHILEVNSEPAIQHTGPRLTWILEDLFKSIAGNFVSPFFRSSESEDQPWTVGEIRDGLRKCLSVEVRGAGGW